MFCRRCSVVVVLKSVPVEARATVADPTHERLRVATPVADKATWACP